MNSKNDYQETRPPSGLVDKVFIVFALSFLVSVLGYAVVISTLFDTNIYSDIDAWIINVVLVSALPALIFYIWNSALALIRCIGRQRLEIRQDRLRFLGAKHDEEHHIHDVTNIELGSASSLDGYETIKMTIGDRSLGYCHDIEHLHYLLSKTQLRETIVACLGSLRKPPSIVSRFCNLRLLLIPFGSLMLALWLHLLIDVSFGILIVPACVLMAFSGAYVVQNRVSMLCMPSELVVNRGRRTKRYPWAEVIALNLKDNEAVIHTKDDKIGFTVGAFDEPVLPFLLALSTKVETTYGSLRSGVYQQG